MAFTPRIWVDRAVQYAGRYLSTPVVGETGKIDLSRAEGTVFVEGDKPDAAGLNDLESRINTAVLELTPTTKTITWTSGYTPTTVLVYKTGNIVTIQIRYDATSIVNAFQIGTLPSDCIPTVGTGFGGMGLYLRPSTQYGSCFLQVTNTGALLIANNNAETMTYAGAFFQYSV